MLDLYPLWLKTRRVYSFASRLPWINRCGFQPSLALSVRLIFNAKSIFFTTLVYSAENQEDKSNTITPVYDIAKPNEHGLSFNYVKKF
ncbi:MAG: hypothetical protein KZQ59_08390, partial [Candidatus Thiodiazotropha sp. (ex Lucinoma aequizonata)]|nr:hypothetical protein [Candidatus Thiodiazotropha sp. (ex Lucinoma aequizonata)]